MTVDLNILDHLADGLYSSVAAVLTKAVANAWDADAENVSINANLEGDGITIVDDGIRMNEDSLNDSLSPSGLSPTHGGGHDPARPSSHGPKWRADRRIISKWSAAADALNIPLKGPEEALLKSEATGTHTSQEPDSGALGERSDRVQQEIAERGVPGPNRPF